MKLIEEIQNIFDENLDRLTIAVIYELADDIIESTVSLVARSEDEFKQLKEKVSNKIKLEIKQNLDRKRNANKS